MRLSNTAWSTTTFSNAYGQRHERSARISLTKKSYTSSTQREPSFAREIAEFQAQSDSSSRRCQSALWAKLSSNFAKLRKKLVIEKLPSEHSEKPNLKTGVENSKRSSTTPTRPKRIGNGRGKCSAPTKPPNTTSSVLLFQPICMAPL